MIRPTTSFFAALAIGALAGCAAAPRAGITKEVVPAQKTGAAPVDRSVEWVRSIGAEAAKSDAGWIRVLYRDGSRSAELPKEWLLSAEAGPRGGEVILGAHADAMETSVMARLSPHWGFAVVLADVDRFELWRDPAKPEESPLSQWKTERRNRRVS